MAVLAEGLAVVAAENEERVVEEAEFVEASAQAFEHVVHPANRRQVVGQRPPSHGRSV